MRAEDIGPMYAACETCCALFPTKPLLTTLPRSPEDMATNTMRIRISSDPASIREHNETHHPQEAGTDAV